MKMEIDLASSHLTRTATRDPELTYNKMTIANLTKISEPHMTWNNYLTSGKAGTGFDFQRYFELIGRNEEQMGEINVSCVDAIKKASAVSSSPAFAHYLCFHAVDSSAPHLSREFVNAHFAFHDKELKGTTDIRCVSYADTVSRLCG
jgi:putative endopeptidase